MSEGHFRGSKSEAAAYLLLGAATGLRSQIGFAAVVQTVPPAKVPKLLRYRAVKPLTLTMALGELIVDQLPSAPDRTAPLGLISRLALGGASTALLASSESRPTRGPALIGASSAAVAAFVGLSVRRELIRRLPPLVAGVVEDAAALLLVVGAMRLSARSPRPPSTIAP